MGWFNIFPDMGNAKIIAPVEDSRIVEGEPCAWLLSDGTFANRFTNTSDPRHQQVVDWIAENGEQFRSFHSAGRIDL